MLFSSANWNNAKEILPYIQTSAALSFMKVESALADAETRYLEKVFGTSLMERIITIYGQETRTDAEAHLLTLAQRAEANLAMYESFDEMQVRLTDAGLQRQDSDTFKQAYRYQEKLVKNNYRNKGLNALDAAMAYLDKNLTDFPEWSESEYKTLRAKSIVKEPAEVDEVMYIESSQIVFCRLLPVIKREERLDLVKVIGQELYNVFISSLANGYEYINNDDTLMLTEEFRGQCARYLIAKAVAQLIRETGTLTDRGMYFESQTSVTDNPETVNPMDMERAHAIAGNIELMARRYEVSLESSIELLMPAYFHGHESDVLKRDNTKKHTYWA